MGTVSRSLLLSGTRLADLQGIYGWRLAKCEVSFNQDAAHCPFFSGGPERT